MAGAVSPPGWPRSATGPFTAAVFVTDADAGAEDEAAGEGDAAGGTYEAGRADSAARADPAGAADTEAASLTEWAAVPAGLDAPLAFGTALVCAALAAWCVGTAFLSGVPAAASPGLAES